MRTKDSARIEETRSRERQKAEQQPRFIDGLCPYYRERLSPMNPLSFTTLPRVAQPIGDNLTLVVFSTLGL